MRKAAAYVFLPSSFVIAGMCLFGSLVVGCKDDATTSATGGMCKDDSASGVVKAPADAETDTHCIDASGKPIKIEVNQASCHLTNLDAATSDHDHGGDEDAGSTTATPDHDDEAAAHYGSEADDDDCKYHVTWSATCVQKNEDITFTVKAINTFDGQPVKGANPYIEAQLTDDHLAPDTMPKTKETSPGTYTIGPMRFNAPGRWTVKFHFAANCTELSDDSPHGHVTFYVDVP